MPPGRAGAHTGSILASIPAPAALTARSEASMTAQPLPAAESIARYELRFQSLFHTGRALTFPCDREGEVNWDAMTEGARASFLRAQGGVGREYASPAVRLTDFH
jgi:hypothetical protein